MPELGSGLRGRPEMRIVHCREGVSHCILSPEPQVERLYRLASRDLPHFSGESPEPATARKPEQLADLELKYKSQVHRMALDDAEVFFNTEDLFRERGETASRRFR
jgi:hypothetical protein